jgi:hypothetical protein
MTEKLMAAADRIAELQAENAKIKAHIDKIIGKCICGHYHCPICENQMEVHDDATYDVFYKSEISRLKSEKQELVSVLEYAVRFVKDADMDYIEAHILKHKEG